jgi:hypothetical protein
MESSKTSQVITAIVAVLNSLNILVFNLTGFTPFQEGQILLIVNGFSALVVVLGYWWTAYRNAKLETELAEVKAALVRAKID